MLRNNGISGTSAFTISTDGGRVEAKKASLLHSIKTFFGFGNARAQNKETLNAIRDAIMNDDKFASGYLKSSDLLRGVKGTITLDKMKTILSDIQKNTSAAEKTKSLSTVAPSEEDEDSKAEKVVAAYDVPLGGVGRLGDFMQV